MVKLVNRAKMKVASGGASTLTLGLACDGYQTFAAAGVADQNKLRYTITDGNDWEIGVGTYTASGTTLARAPTESSNSGNAITCGSGAEIFVTMAAEDFTGNVAPRFTTTPPASLALNKDGTSVTLTGVAVDEGGFPIIYSWDGFDGSTIYNDLSLPPQLASAPTINQLTGSIALVGSQSASNAGIFKFRLKASDGVKTAVSTSTLTLSFDFNIAGASYNGVSFNLVSQLDYANTINFNANGTKMFTGGYGSDKVFQYSLSTGFALSTANYDNVSLDVSAEDGNLRELYFNPTGSKMFMLGQSNGRVYQYSLSSVFNLSTASYDNVSFALTANNYELGMTFSTTGTKMFITDGDADKVFQYSLSSGFDLSTASYDNVSFSVLSQDTDPSALAFNSLGTKMYIVGYDSDKVYQYSLSTGFDLTTASYDNVSFSLTSQLSKPQGIAFGGNKMFVVCQSNDRAYEYNI